MTRRFLRLPEVIARAGFSRSTLYRELSFGRFPKPIQISENTVAWLESDLEDWIDSKLEKPGGSK